MAANPEQARAAFENVYSSDVWDLKNLKSDPPQYQHFAGLISGVMQRFGLRSVTEFGCGFWSYAKLIDWESYDGYDIVPGIVQWNASLHSAPHVRFHVMARDVIPAPADLLISKDVLQHLPTADVLHYLAMFKPRYKWLLITNDINSEHGTNTDIAAGGHRGLRLDQPPFNESVEVLDEWVLPDFPAYRKQACLLRGMP